MNAIDIGKKIKQRRKTLKLTQRQAAGLCNVGVRFLSELENGKPTAEIGLVIKVLNNLGMDVTIKERQY